MHVAPTSSKSLLASNFKSEPTEIHLCKIIEIVTKVSKQLNSHGIATYVQINMHKGTLKA